MESNSSGTYPSNNHHHITWEALRVTNQARIPVITTTTTCGYQRESPMDRVFFVCPLVLVLLVITGIRAWWVTLGASHVMWWWLLLGYVPDELLLVLPMECGGGYYWDTCLMSYFRCFSCNVVVVITGIRAWWVTLGASHVMWWWLLLGNVPDELLSVLPM